MATPTKKSVLITGAGTAGIGGALAREFHAQGYRVFATVRRPEAAAGLAEMGIEVLQLDVTSSTDIQRVRDIVSERTGGTLDVLVNNAGFGHNTPAADLDIDGAVQQIFAVNLFAVMRMVQEFIHLLIAAEGTVVNIGSVCGVVPLAFGSAYNASKAAVLQYGNTLRVEVKPFGVKVMTIITGGVKSNIAAYTTENSTLRPGSLYAPIQSHYTRCATASQVNAMDTDEYARDVVAQVVGGRKPAHYWQGASAWVIWGIATFGWGTAFDWAMGRKFGFDELGRMWREGKKGKQS